MAGNRFQSWFAGLWPRRLEVSTPWVDVLERYEGTASDWSELRAGEPPAGALRGDRPLRVRGQLGEQTMRRLLRALARAHSGGRLTALMAEGRAELRLSGGVVLATRLDPGRRVGDLLLSEGLVKRRDLLDVLELQETTDETRPVGSLLLERRAVEERALRWALLHHAEACLAEVLDWRDGFFKWEDWSLLPPWPAGALCDGRMSLERMLVRCESARGDAREVSRRLGPRRIPT